VEADDRAPYAPTIAVGALLDFNANKILEAELSHSPTA